MQQVPTAPLSEMLDVTYAFLGARFLYIYGIRAQCNKHPAFCLTRNTPRAFCCTCASTLSDELSAYVATYTVLVVAATITPSFAAIRLLLLGVWLRYPYWVSISLHFGLLVWQHMASKRPLIWLQCFPSGWASQVLFALHLDAFKHFKGLPIYVMSNRVSRYAWYWWT